MEFNAQNFPIFLVYHFIGCFRRFLQFIESLEIFDLIFIHKRAEIRVNLSEFINII
jgi:hypothetical protein